STNYRVPDAQSPLLNQDRCHRTSADFLLGFHDHAVGSGMGVGAKLHQVGLESDVLQEVVKTGLRLGGNRHGLGLAAVFAGNQVVLGELGLDAVGVGVGPVHLVDGDDDWHARSLRVVDCFDRLGHYAVVRGDYEDGDIGNAGTAGPHGREGRVAWRIEEGDL